MKYEVILCIGEACVCSWRFKSINQVIKFLSNCDLSLVTADVFRLCDFHQFDAKELLEVFYA